MLMRIGQPQLLSHLRILRRLPHLRSLSLLRHGDGVVVCKVGWKVVGCPPGLLLGLNSPRSGLGGFSIYRSQR
jgi:hypothetical protein